MKEVLVGIGITVGGAAVLYIAAMILRTFKAVSTLADCDKRRSRQMGALFAINQGQSKAMRATLEVVSGIRNNGNVHEAIDNLDAVDATFEEFAAKEAWK